MSRRYYVVTPHPTSPLTRHVVITRHATLAEARAGLEVARFDGHADAQIAADPACSDCHDSGYVRTTMGEMVCRGEGHR